MTIFSIQVSAPASTTLLSDDAETLGEVIEDIFPHQTEDAYLNWNGVRIALNYKYDVSAIASDVVSMLAGLLSRPHGDSIVDWASSSFRGRWYLHWSNGQLRVEPEWEQVTGNIEAALTVSGTLEISVNEFIAEWMELLTFLGRKLDSLALPSELEGVTELRHVLRAAKRSARGLLYGESSPVKAPVV